MIGAVLRARYELTGLIYDGPIFAAYSARDRAAGRDVCLRLVKAPFSSETPFIAALSRAIAKYSTIHQPGIETLVELEEHQGARFVVSDLTRGPTLAERIRKLAPFSTPVSVATGISLCQALDPVHRLGYSHGDLQGSNICVLADGEVRLQLTGIWEAYSASTTAGALVVPGMAPYLAPEVSNGGMPTPSSDVYAVGILIFELLAGRKPYISDAPAGYAQQHANSPVPGVRSVNASTPIVLEEIVKKAMAKDPVDRYASAGEMLSDLRIMQDALRFGRSLTWPLRAGAAATPKPAAPAQPVAPRMSAIREEPEDREPRVERDVPVWMSVAFAFLSAVVLSLVAVWLIFNLNKPQLVQVPNVRGLSTLEARNLLQSSHLQMRVVSRQASERVELDHVLDVDPEPGTRIPQNGTVRLTISQGSRLVAVPDLTGDTVDVARSILGNLDLLLDSDVGKMNLPNTTPDSVVKQDPAANTKVERNSKVKVFIESVDVAPPPSANPPAQPNTLTPDNTDEPPTYMYTLTIHAEDLANPTEIRVDMKDDDGTRTVYDQVQNAGDKFVVSATGKGKQAEFLIYYDNRLVKQLTQKADAQATSGTTP